MTDSETHVIWHCTSIWKAMFQQWWDLRLLVTRLWSWFGSRANPWIYLKCSVGLTLSSPLQCTSDCPHRAAAIFHHSYLPLLETRPPWRGMASAGLRQGVLLNEWTKKRSKIQVGTPSLMVVYRKDSLTLLWHVCRRVSFVCVFCLFWCFSLCLFACSNAHWVASACTSTNPAAQRAATRVFWYCMFVYKSSQIAKPFSRPMSESMVPSIKAAWIKEPDNKDSQLLAQQHFHRACRKFNSGGPVSLQIAKATNVKIRAIHWHYVSTLQHGDVVKRLGNLVASLSVKFIAWARKCTLGRDNLKSYTPRKWKALNHWRAFWVGMIA